MSLSRENFILGEIEKEEVFELYKLKTLALFSCTQAYPSTANLKKSFALLNECVKLNLPYMVEEDVLADVGKFDIKQELQNWKAILEHKEKHKDEIRKKDEATKKEISIILEDVQKLIKARETRKANK